MRNRGIVLTAGALFSGAVVVVWFFSNPEHLTLKEANSELADFSEKTLVLAAATGLAAMATLEILKRLLHLRGWFHSSRLRRIGSDLLSFGPSTWRLDPASRSKSPEPREGIDFQIARSLFLKQTAGQQADSTEEAEPPDRVLTKRASASARVRRLDVPLEQLVAQLAQQVDGAVDEIAGLRLSQRGRSLLTGLLGDRVVDVVMPRRSAASGPDASKLRLVISDEAYRRSMGLLEDLFGQQGRYSSVEWSGEELIRLRTETQAALDDFQVSVGNAWRWRLRLSSCVLASLFATLALIYVPVPAAAKTAALGSSFIIGGLFAGVFRDLVALIERFRQ